MLARIHGLLTPITAPGNRGQPENEMISQITITKTGRFRAETMFQWLGTFKTREKAEAAIAIEKNRVAFIAAEVAKHDGDTYHTAMQARMDAEKAWANGVRS